MTQTKTLDQFIKEQAISIKLTRIDDNPIMDGMGEGAKHWRVTLSRYRKATKLFHATEYLTVNFSQGSAHIKPPTIADVLDCLASDSMGLDDGFDSWASDLGYDTDSREAEAIFNVCKDQAKGLKDMLGPGSYKELLWDVERE